MTTPIEQARHLGNAPYDRQVLTSHLIEQMRRWRFTKPYDNSRMLSPARATFDVLDGLEGASMAERWAIFAEQVWPRWQAGQDRLQLGARWGFGVWALVISRLVQPQWASIATVRIGDWTKILPADDPITLARQRLADAAENCAIGTPALHGQAVNMATRLLLTRGTDRIEDLSEDDLLIPPAGTRGADVLDVLLCQLGVFDRSPRSGTARRRIIPRHTERELAVVAGVPEPFVEVVGLYLEAYARRLSDSYPTLRHKAVALGHFFRYLHQTHPDVTSCAEITPAQARGFVPHAVELARTFQRGRARQDDADRTTADRVMTAMRDPSVTDHTTASNIPVSLVEEPGLAETTLEVNARGGRTLRRATDGRLMCTSGFAVRRNNGNRGIITARHCPNNLTYGWNQGVITFGSNANRINRGLIDIQFHRINSGHRVSPFFLGSSPRDDRVVRAVANGPVGTVACHYGAATRYSCDRIRLVNRCVSLSGTTYCGLDRTSSHVSAGGDSGGPWFLGNTARGTHTGGGSAGSIFTRIGRVANNMNARVLRRP